MRLCFQKRGVEYIAAAVVEEVFWPETEHDCARSSATWGRCVTIHRNNASGSVLWDGLKGAKQCAPHTGVTVSCSFRKGEMEACKQHLNSLQHSRYSFTFTRNVSFASQHPNNDLGSFINTAAVVSLPRRWRLAVAWGAAHARDHGMTFLHHT